MKIFVRCVQVHSGGDPAGEDLLGPRRLPHDGDDLPPVVRVLRRRGRRTAERRAHSLRPGKQVSRGGRNLQTTRQEEVRQR